MQKKLNDEILATLGKISEQFQYPINNKQQFIENLNKSSLNIDSEIIRGKIDNVDPDLVRRIIPAYYFPISDSIDFTDKVMELFDHAGVTLLNAFGEGPFPEPNYPGNPNPDKSGW